MIRLEQSIVKYLVLPSATTMLPSLPLVIEYAPLADIPFKITEVSSLICASKIFVGTSHCTVISFEFV